MTVIFLLWNIKTLKKTLKKKKKFLILVVNSEDDLKHIEEKQTMSFGYYANWPKLIGNLPDFIHALFWL